jgi:hypothetical protein
MFFQDIHELDEALTASSRLYPYPFMAPDVPIGSDELEKLLRAGNMEKALWAQLTESANGLRAIAYIQSGTYARAELPKISSIDWIAKQLGITFGDEVMPTKESVQPPRRPPFKVGQIWFINRDYEVSRGGEIQKRRLNEGAVGSVLITSGPVVTQNDIVIRGVPVDTAECWPDQCWTFRDVQVEYEPNSDDVHPEDRKLVVHTWLEYPISHDQLAVCLGEVLPDQMALVSRVARLEAGIVTKAISDSSAEMSEEEVQIEKDRLFDYARFLSVTADTRMSLLG